MGDRNPILVATDFSERSHNAVARAFDLAALHQAPLVVLHVIDPVPGQAFAQWMPRIQAAIDQRFAQLGERAEAAGLDAEFIVREGKPFAEAIAVGRAVEAQTIVVGAHAHEPLKDVFLGSMPARVIRKGDRPVLVCRPDTPAPYRRAMAMVDLSEGSRRALERMAALLGPDVELHVFFCFQVPHYIHPVLEPEGAVSAELPPLEAEWRETAAADLAAFLERCELNGRDVQTHLVAGTPVELALDVAERHEIDLIAVGTRGSTDLASLLLGSVAEGVLSLAPGDVLAVPPADRSGFQLP